MMRNTWRANPFFLEQSRRTAERVVVEEARVALAGLDGAACHPSLAQIEHAGPLCYVGTRLMACAVKSL